MKDISPYLKLIRPLNCVMGSIGVFVGIIIGAGLELKPFLIDIIIALILVFIFMAGANTLNDYYDRKVDKTNHPKRPIPSGKVKARSALRFGGILLVLSILMSFFINLTAFLIVIIAGILIIAYEILLKNKGFIGNITISVLVGLLFIFGGAVVKSFDLIIILALMAGLATLGREIVKDIQDIKGDIHRFTLPKKIGIRSAGFVAAAALIIAIMISPVPYFPEIIPFLKITQDVGLQYLIIVLLADIVFISSIKDIRNNPRKSSELLKVGMVFALVAFLSVAFF